MRFSLLFVFLLLTLSCIALAMYASYGLIGLLFLVPHLAAAFGTWYCLRRGWRVVGFGSIALYSFAWAMTHLIGSPVVTDDFATRIADLRWTYSSDPGPLQRIKYDPYLNGTEWELSESYFFVGNATSPCPFVVSLDYSYSAGPTAGGGGRVYFLWGMHGSPFAVQSHWFS